MPPGRDPGATHCNGDDIVEVESQNCRTTGGRATLNLRSIIAPGEVLRPALGARVIQADPPTTYRVRSMRLNPLEVVTHATGQPQICFVITPATCSWDDMLDLKRSEDQVLRAAAVATAITGL